MTNRLHTGYFSSFTINILFVLLVIVGLALIPLLSIQLNPTRYLPEMTVSWSWPRIPARVVEQEVTSRIEAVVSTIPGVEKITSSTANGSGSVRIAFDARTDLQQKRFEVAALIRETRTKLPDGVSYPVVSVRMPDNERGTEILVYQINGTSGASYIQKLVEEQVKPRLAIVEGVYNINVYGATSTGWELTYNNDLLIQLAITPGEMIEGINRWLLREEIGSALVKRETGPDTRIYLTLQANNPDRLRWDVIPIAKRGGRIIHLGDIAGVRLVEQAAGSYYRINGLNTVNMVVSTEKNVNNLKVAAGVKRMMESVQQTLPTGYSARISYDATITLRKELTRVMYRTLASVIMLLLFVFAMSRQFRYLAIISISLVANLAIALIFYWLLKLEIHLYSLAGITVSFGIIIDNTIVMTDHLRHYRNRKVFLAILAATLTTVGALSVIFFLDQESRVKLTDFAAVVIVNLVVSLAVALFFIPSLLDKIPLRLQRSAAMWRRKRRVIRFNRSYRTFIAGGLKRRWIFILLLLLGFGLPVFLLPERLPAGYSSYEISGGQAPEPTGAESLYNKIFGSEKYNRKIRPVINKSLGGSLRLFADRLKSSFGYYYYGAGDEEVRTRLNITIGRSQEGLTLGHLNEVCTRVENMLAGYDEIEMFTTSIYSAESATMNITFDREAENGIFPFLLKVRIEDFMMGIGSYWAHVSGVGRAFSNQVGSDYINGSWAVAMKGYNYDDLMMYAEELKARLLEHPRIQEVYITGSGVRFGNKKITRSRMTFNEEWLASNNSDIRYTFNEIGRYSAVTRPAGLIYANGFIAPLNIRPLQAESYDDWWVNNMPVWSPSGNYLKLRDFSNIKRDITDNIITREDQEYIIMVLYDFIGNAELGNIVLDRNLDETKALLPLGYSAEKSRYSYSWGEKKNNFYLIFLVVLIIYFICAILLESLTQPLAVISLIPFSFIGLFLTFHLFRIRPDEGALAALLLLAGLVVNSALYITNDYNNFMKRGPGMKPVRMYVKAFNAKIVPVMLTILSTVIGLSPFLFAGRDERFWFALAAGTVGGLIFSIVGLVLFLPVFMGYRGTGRRGER